MFTYRFSRSFYNILCDAACLQCLIRWCLIHDIHHDIFHNRSQTSGSRLSLQEVSAIVSSAFLSNVSLTPSSSSIFWYCFVNAFFGSVRIFTNASLSSISNATVTGTRPTSSESGRISQDPVAISAEAVCLHRLHVSPQSLH